MMESDAAMTEDLIAYNIIPLDGPTLTNAIVGMPEVSLLPSMYVSSSLFIHQKKKKKVCLKFIFGYYCHYLTRGTYCQVRAAVSALKYFTGLPTLPSDFSIPATRDADMLDFLHYIFGFQVCTFTTSKYES
jgi:callose synthase